MFTGIVEHRGSVISAERADGALRVTLDTGPLPEVGQGGSIAVNGVCLTAVTADAGWVTVEVVEETLARSTLGSLRDGDPVNLELPVKVDGRLGGHIVQGHVDGVGVIAEVVSEGEGKRMRLEAPSELMRYVVEKGSVTVDGVSLTVADVHGNQIEFALIPHSLQATTLGLRSAGEKVNLEVDVLAKYVERLMRADR